MLGQAGFGGKRSLSCWHSDGTTLAAKKLHHRKWSMEESVHLNTQVFHFTHGQLALPTERGWTLALLCPLAEMSTDLMGPEWANILATPEIRVGKKMLRDTKRVFHLKNCRRQTLLIYVFYTRSFS